MTVRSSSSDGVARETPEETPLTATVVVLLALIVTGESDPTPVRLGKTKERLGATGDSVTDDWTPLPPSAPWPTPTPIWEVALTLVGGLVAPALIAVRPPAVETPVTFWLAPKPEREEITDAVETPLIVQNASSETAERAGDALNPAREKFSLAETAETTV